MSTTFDTLETRLSQGTGDWIQVDTTTSYISTNNTVLSTSLNKYDHGSDDYFNNWYCVFTEGVNFTAGTLERQVSDYATSGGAITVQGAVLAAEAGHITIRLYKYSQEQKWQAINNAARSVPGLFRYIDNRTMTTGNLLVDGHLEDWGTSTSAMTHWTASTATLLKTTTAGSIRGGATSCKVTDTTANGYIGQSSNTYPQLLNTMGKTVTAECWAYPEVLNDAVLQIYYVSSAGVATTLASTTTCPVGVWTLLKLENQAIPDNITRLDVRCKVTTNLSYVYFDAVRLTGSGLGLRRYLLPQDFQSGGAIEQVHIQSGNYSDDPCDDLRPEDFTPVFGSKYIYDAGYKYIELPTSYSTPAQIQLLGTSALEDDLDAGTDTVSIDDPRTNLLVAQAQIELADILAAAPSSQDTSRFEQMRAKGERRLAELSHLRMPQRARHLNIREY